jgi:L-alanine-DL-glutamate epimerase-like enolase superfamily enzyme
LERIPPVDLRYDIVILNHETHLYSEVMRLRIESAELNALEIPFVMPPMSHSAHKDRGACDSVIIKLSADGVDGYGEAVFREYVSRSAGGEKDLAVLAAGIARRLIDPLLGRDIAWHDAARDGRDIDPSDLPMLCALETALLDLACRLSGRDAYETLGQEPVRQIAAISGVIPMYPPEVAARTLVQFARLGVRSFKVKLGSDPVANGAVLAACRAAAGEGADLRVDANGAWRSSEAEVHLNTCAAAGVTAVEQPFPVEAPGANAALRRGVERGFLFIADEGFLSEGDLDQISRAGTYRLLNFRLAKNGGLTRVLRLARIAADRGIGHQLGCMVGETGILSALGRIAASLLPAPRWVEGSYDRILYAEHLANRDFGFGPDGTATVIRGAGLGYTILEPRLAHFTVSRVKLF